ncbi:Sec1-like protein [Macleaya cordata]|uniref:Sec1-like protein n=1 Tax=Macleaya cordata TaxID=56857 RepID=A0A200QU40_MACCD|nr:Sec1-like protein [Macleaya cordata]
MALADVGKSCLDSIRQISDHIEDAILYLDAGCTEAFQFLGAFPLLLELGARAVCSLENVSSLDAVVDWNSNVKHAKKIVVITSRLLSDAHRYILRCLSMHQAVLHCTIFTSISEIAHSAYADSPLGPDAFHEYESLLLQDYEEFVKKCEIKDKISSRPTDFGQSEESNFNESLASEDEGWSKFSLSEEEIPHPEASPRENIDEANLMCFKGDGLLRLDVSVHHFPMILCPLSARVFVLPSEGTVAEACLSYEHEDSLGPGLPSISTGLPSEGEDTPPGAILTAHLLYHLAAKMDLKMEIFSLGDMSKTIGKIMMDMSSLYDVGRRKRSAGLLLIDRTLDLLTPCCHGDSLVDRIFSSLPRRQRASSSLVNQNKHGSASIHRAPLDVQIPLGKLYTKEEEPAIWPIEGIEAFSCGWTSSNSATQMADSTDARTRIHGETSIDSDIGSLSGSFVTTENHRGAEYLEALMDRRTKDGATLIKKWLQETLREEKVSVNVRTRPSFTTTSELLSMVKALAKDQSSLVKNKGIVQLAIAAVLSLSEPHTSHWDAFVSAEKILSASCGDTSQTLSAQIRDLIDRSVLVKTQEQKKQNMESSQGLLSFQDALLLAITGYILAGENFPTSGSGGPFSWEEEHFLKEAIVDAVLENPSAARLKFFRGMEEELEANANKAKMEKPKEVSSNQSTLDDFDDDQWGNWGDEDTEHNNEQVYDDMQLKLELRDRVDNLFKLFHKLSSLKRKNIMLRNGPLASESNYGGDLYMGKGLLYKLLTMVLGKYEVPGLEYHSSAVGRLFKSGFGRFGLGQAKPSLGEQSLILVFVVGGINCHEVFEARDALSQSGREDIELIIGGTTLLTPDDMFDLLLVS